jgi:thiamine pyrophosphate-dependent acetolactate synthase large subunit-like protein/aspartate/tyrosine/aromatic aminotransferase
MDLDGAQEGALTPRRRAPGGKERPRVIDATLGILLDERGRPLVMRCLKRALRELPAEAWVPYAPPTGEAGYLDAVRRAVLGRDRALAQAAVAVATPGATGAVKLALSAFLEAGHAALTTSHHWKPYTDIASFHDRRLATFEMLGAAASFDVEALDQALGKAVREQRRALLILNDPCHNPTGYSLTAAEWAAVSDVVGAWARQAPIAVLLDTAYADYAPAGLSLPLAALARLSRSAPVTIAVAWSASKSFTAYGLRAGALLAIPAEAGSAGRLEAVLAHASLASWGNCNRGGMLVAERLLGDPTLAEAARVERQGLVRLLEGRAAELRRVAGQHGLAYVPHHGGFFATVLVRDPERVAQAMRVQGVLVVPGPGSVRLALSAIATHDVAPALELLARAAASSAGPGGAGVSIPVSQAQALVRALEDLGYRRAFGIPGGAIAGLYAALARSSIRTILTQHEGGAAYMAMGQSLATAGREVGLCFGTSGPGITNLITGVAAAFEEQVPMFVLTGNVSTELAGKGAAQDATPGGIDAVGMLRAVTARSVTAAAARDIVPLAVELHEAAVRARRPVHLNVPVNLAAAPAGGEARRLAALAPRCALDPDGARDVRASDRALDEAVQALLAAERPVVLAGHGIKVSGLGAALARALDAAAVPALCTSHGKGILPDDHPMLVGVFGFAAPPSSTAFLDAYQPDAIAFLGTDLGETSTAGWSPLLARPALKIHVDRDPSRFHRAYRAELAVRAELDAFLARLVDVARTADPTGARRRRRLDAVSAWRPPAPAEPEPARAPAGLVSPPALMAALAGRLPRDALVFADIGNTMAWVLHELPIRDRQELYVPMALGAMGSALGGAIGAQAARPDRPVVALVGDCAMTMHGAEMLTALLAQLPVKVLVLNDQGHGMVDHGLALLGMRAGGLRHPRRVDFTAFGQALGVRALQVGSLREFVAVDWARCFAAPEPLIVDVAIDPAVVPPILARTRVLGVGDSSAGGDR